MNVVCLVGLLLGVEFHNAVGSVSDCKARGPKFESQLGHVTFVDIDHAVVPTINPPHPLIQEGQLSSETMCTKF